MALLRTSHHTIPFRRAAICMVLAASFLLPPCVSAELRRGEKSFGPKIGYVGKNKSVSAGLAFQYSFSRHIRLVPEANVVFRHQDLDAISVALNVHFPFGFENDRIALYPLAGVEYVSWNRHLSDMQQSDKDVTSHTNRIGACGGAGIEFRCTQTFKISLEGRYTFVKRFSTAQASVGISYVF